MSTNQFDRAAERRNDDSAKHNEGYRQGKAEGRNEGREDGLVEGRAAAEKEYRDRPTYKKILDLF